ncbi:MAG: zinc ribbon domain-containing protein [Betaproteobacteria bacterium]|nr:zinc ribbon domain-containing protein [Betaproteobacteria bacterium]
MAYCPYCGHEITADATKCPSCKVDLGSRATQRPISTQTQQVRVSRESSWPALVYLLITYTIICIATVALAVGESGHHLALYQLIAVVICQPWLAFCWVLGPLGLIPDFSLNAWSVAALSGLNITMLAVIVFGLRPKAHATKTK